MASAGKGGGADRFWGVQGASFFFGSFLFFRARENRDGFIIKGELKTPMADSAGRVAGERGRKGNWGGGEKGEGGRGKGEGTGQRRGERGGGGGTSERASRGPTRKKDRSRRRRSRTQTTDHEGGAQRAWAWPKRESGGGERRQRPCRGSERASRGEERGEPAGDSHQGRAKAARVALGPNGRASKPQVWRRLWSGKLGELRRSELCKTVVRAAW